MGDRVRELVRQRGRHVGSRWARANPDALARVVVVAAGVVAGEWVILGGGECQAERGGMGDKRGPERRGAGVITLGGRMNRRMPRVGMAGDGVGLADVEHMHDREGHAALDLFGSGLTFVGTTDTIIGQVETMRARVPAEWVFVWNYNGLVPHDTICRSLATWQEQVLPRVT